MTSPRPTHEPPPKEALHALGHYRLLRILGRGGMSEVYLGYDLNARQLVAVKVLTEELANDPLQVHRFEREAELTTQLHHANIIRGFDNGRDAATGRYYLVLEYVDGPTAQQILDRSGRLSVSDVVHIGLALAQALKHLHDRNYIHRDIKPDNILLSPDGDTKLADLGLVKWDDGNAAPLTAVDAGFGTSHYMPVEQTANAHFVDERSDIFALGATLYHLLTGRVPFPGDNHQEVTRMKQRGVFTPPALLNPTVPLALEVILTQMLDANPERRYHTADEVISALLRSRLITRLPNFAAKGESRPDPLADELASLSQPTRPDLRLKASNHRKTRAARWWFLKFRDRRGQFSTRKATTARVVTELKNGRLRKAFATREFGGKLRPLAEFPEFHAYFATAPSTKPVPITPPRRLTCRYRCTLTSLGLGLFALASLAGLYRCFWHHS